MGWQFKIRTPLWFSLTVGLLITDATVHFCLLCTVSSWASPVRDAAHSHPLPFRDGVVYFVSSDVSWYLHAWWIAVGLFFLLAVMLVINRHQLERTV